MSEAKAPYNLSPDSPPPLTFKQVKEKLALINVVFCDPFQDGKHSYFAGPDTSNRKYDFPHPSGPRTFASCSIVQNNKVGV